MFAAYMNFLFSVLEQVSIGMCLYFYMKHNARQIYARPVWYVLGFGSFMVLMYVSAIYGQIHGLPWIGVVIMAIAPMAIGWLLFHRKVSTLIFDFLFSVLLFFSMEIGIFVSNIILLQTGTTAYAWVGVIAMAVKILFMILTTMLCTYWLKGYRKYHLSKKQAFLTLLLPAFSLFFFLSLLRMGFVYVQLYSYSLLLANLIGLILLNFYFYYLFGYFFRTKALEQELELYQAQNTMRFHYYEQLDEKYQESRKVIHDMKNHLAAVEHLYREEKNSPGQEYVQDLYHMLNILGEKYYSSNKMLNIIFNDKLGAATGRGIAVSAEIGDVDFSDFRDMDITTVFANLLDNALEAATACKETPYINIKIQEVHAFRVISISNSWNPEVPKQGHTGIGLKNVCQTLESYGGTLTSEAVGNEYRVSIIIPGKENT